MSAAKQAPPVKAASAGTADAAKQLEKLEVKTKAVNANNIARVANSQLANADEKLHPLLSLKSGKAIDKFPETARAIGKLSLTAVDSILSTLEADRSGNEEAKREKLRLQLGLKPNPA